MKPYTDWQRSRNKLSRLEVQLMMAEEMRRKYPRTETTTVSDEFHTTED